MNTTLVKPIAGALAREMDTRNISIRTLANQTGISSAMVGFVKAGTRGISLDRAERIAEALDRPVGALFEHKNGDPLGGAR